MQLIHQQTRQTHMWSIYLAAELSRYRRGRGCIQVSMIPMIRTLPNVTWPKPKRRLKTPQEAFGERDWKVSLSSITTISTVSWISNLRSLEKFKLNMAMLKTLLASTASIKEEKLSGLFMRSSKRSRETNEKLHLRWLCNFLFGLFFIANSLELLIDSEWKYFIHKYTHRDNFHGAFNCCSNDPHFQIAT